MLSNATSHLISIHRRWMPRPQADVQTNRHIKQEKRKKHGMKFFCLPIFKMLLDKRDVRKGEAGRLQGCWVSWKGLA